MRVAHRFAKLQIPSNAVPLLEGNAVLGYLVGRGKAGATAGAGARGRKGTHRRFALASQRLSEVEISLTDMFGGAVDTDDAELLLPAMAATVAWKLSSDAGLKGRVVNVTELSQRVFEHCRRWFPGQSLEDVARVSEQMAKNRPYLTSEQIADVLEMTWERRVRLSLRTIGVAGMSRRQLKSAAKKLKRQKDRKRAEHARRAIGVLPRAQYEQRSDTALAKRLGVNRKSIARWRQAGILEMKIYEYECRMCVADKGSTYSTRDADGTQPANAVGALTAPTCNCRS